MSDGTYVVPEDDPLRPIREEVPPPPGAIPTAPTSVAIGIPADLVRRRPDVRRAERQVAAQSARIGIAESDFYPQISLTGTIGAAAVQFADLSDIPASMIGSVGPSYRWAIFNYGRIVNNVRSQDAQFQQLAFAYQDTVLRAGQEAEDAIVNFLRAQERNQRLRESVQASSRTVDITYDQYQFGAVDFTPVFLFQTIVADAQDDEAASRGEIALNLIALYKALGGGWQIRLSRLPSPSAPPPPVSDVDVPEPIPAPPG
jgi:outer membrane protein TolC